MCAGPEKSIEDQKQRFRRSPATHDDIVRRNGVVALRDCRAQLMVAGCMGISERETVPSLPGVLVRQLEKVRQGVTLNIRSTQDMLDGELPPSKESFKFGLAGYHPVRYL